MSQKNDYTSEELKLILEKLEKYRKTTGSLSPYYQKLLVWHKNVDKRYAWVALLSLWFIMVGTLSPYRIYGLIYAKVTAEEVYTREEASWPATMTFTVQNCFGPIVSIFIYYISTRKSLFIGSILVAATNGLTVLSSSLVLDIFMIGIVQGIGYSFIFIPLLEIINSYFLKYRSLALGIALTGGTASMFILTPLFRWVLDTYPWRHAYLAISMVCCISFLVLPLLKPNPQPKPSGEFKSDESKISSSLEDEIKFEMKAVCPTTAKKQPPTNSNLDETSRASQSSERLSANNRDQDKQEEGFKIVRVLDILKTPSFHLIWYNEVLYYWLHSIYTLILIDFGMDHGCTLKQAEALIACQSAGELFGRICLTYLIDMNLVSNRILNVFVLISIAALLVIISQASGYFTLAALTVLLSALIPLLYIFVNMFLVEYIGEQRVTLSHGMASFINGVSLFFRPLAVGYCRDHLQSYEYLLFCLAGASALCGVLWILQPLIRKIFEKKLDQGLTCNNQIAL